MLLNTPEDYRNKLVEAFKAKRLSQNVTQKELSCKSGVALSTLRRYEKTGMISLSSFIKLTFALGCAAPLHDLFGDETQYESMEELLKSNEPKQVRKRASRKKE